MKLRTSPKQAGFTLGEMMISISLSSIVLAAAITSGVSLQKSFGAIDNYFTTHMQQIRIIDYLSRDVKRGLIVTTSVDLQSVTMNLPNYIIQAGDSEAVANPSLIGTPRTPTISYLSRDVKRGLIVTTSVDLQSVTMNLPNYIIQAGDSEAVANPSLIGTPRT